MSRAEAQGSRDWKKVGEVADMKYLASFLSANSAPLYESSFLFP